MSREDHDPGVVIIGAGHAGAALALALRARDADLVITLIGEEPELPYHRPPLSKSFPVPPELPEPQLLRPAEAWQTAGIALHTGARAKHIDRAARQVVLADGARLDYAQLVLATGARAHQLPGPLPDGVMVLRDILDARKLAARLSSARHVAIVGAGYIGLETAAALAGRGVDVTVIERAPRVLARVASPPISAWVQHRHEARGTRFCLSTGLAALDVRQGAIHALELEDGNTLPADLVLLGIGASPEIGLAYAAGLATDDGIVVDALCRSSDPAIFAIGDCARFPCPVTGALVRRESIQNAQDMARALAANLTGAATTAYRAVPWFWSDQGSDKLQSAGFFLPGCETEIVGDPDAHSFSVLHHCDGQLFASESVNDARTHMQTRKSLRELLHDAPGASSLAAS